MATSVPIFKMLHFPSPCGQGCFQILKLWNPFSYCSAFRHQKTPFSCRQTAKALLKFSGFTWKPCRVSRASVFFTCKVSSSYSFISIQPFFWPTFLSQCTSRGGESIYWLYTCYIRLHSDIWQYAPIHLVHNGLFQSLLTTLKTKQLTKV